MNRLYIILILVLTQHANGFCQTVQIDSIINLLNKNKKQDTVKVATLIALASQLVNSNADTSEIILTEAKNISDKLHYLKGQTEYCIYMSAINSEKISSQRIDSITQQGIQYAKKSGDKVLLGRTMNQRGNYFKLIANHDSAVYYYLNAKNLFEQAKNYTKFTVAITNLSNEYFVLKNFEKAKATAEQALQYAKQYNQSLVCNVLGKLGNIALEQHDYKKAEQYYKQSIEEGTKINNLYSNLGMMSNLVVCYSYEKKYTEMLELANKTYTLAVEFESPENIQYALKSLASAQYFNQQFEKAKATIQQELMYSIDNKISNDFHEEYILLADIAIAQHDFSAADSLRAIADSIQQIYVNDEIRNNTMDLEAKYETQKKQAQIISLEKQKQARNFWIYGLLFVLAAGSIIGFFIYRFLNQKKIITEQQLQQHLQEKELEATKTVLKVQEEERGRVAKDLHDGLGGMLSGIKLNLSAMKGNVILHEQDANLFTKSILQLDSAIAEMRRLAHNMMPESLLKFGLVQAIHDYCESINESKIIQLTFKYFALNQRLENSTEIVLYRIIQELVNNAIKHAQAKNILIQLTKNENQLTLTVEDDGKGFDVKMLENIKGFGLTNIQSRVDYLKGNLEIDSKQNIGTSFYITIPV